MELPKVMIKLFVMCQIAACGQFHGEQWDQTKGLRKTYETKYPSRYGYSQDQKGASSEKEEQLIEVAPVNAFVAAMTKLLAALLIALGAEVTIVGKRQALGEDRERFHHNKPWQYALVTEALLMGSTGESVGCLQRASCEAPTAAQIFATSFQAINLLSATHLLPVDANEKYDTVAQVLESSSKKGINSNEPCHQLYPCKLWAELTAATLKSNI